MVNHRLEEGDNGRSHGAEVVVPHRGRGEPAFEDDFQELGHLAGEVGGAQGRAIREEPSKSLRRGILGLASPGVGSRAGQRCEESGSFGPKRVAGEPEVAPMGSSSRSRRAIASWAAR